MSVSFIVSLKLARLPLAAIISVKRELAILGRLRTWMQVTREASPNVSNEWRKKKKYHLRKCPVSPSALHRSIKWVASGSSWRLSPPIWAICCALCWHYTFVQPDLTARARTWKALFLITEGKTSSKWGDFSHTHHHQLPSYCTLLLWTRFEKLEWGTVTRGSA